jgi:chromosome segregation ATPase
MDSILSVRISEELKEKFQSLAEGEGINNKEFMDLIIRSYEVNKVATNTDFIKSDIEELQSIIKRILDIYINIIEKNKIKSSEMINNFKGTLEEESNKNEKLKSNSEIIKKELEDLKVENKEFKDSLKECKSLLEKEREDAKGYKDLNLMLKDKVTELNDYKYEAENLRKINREIDADLKILNQEKESYINKLNEELNHKNLLEEQFKDVKSSYESKIVGITEEFKRQIKLKDDETIISIQKEVLQKEEEYRKEIWSIKSIYDDKISKLMDDKEQLLLTMRDNITNNNVKNI